MIQTINEIHAPNCFRDWLIAKCFWSPLPNGPSRWTEGDRNVICTSALEAEPQAVRLSCAWESFVYYLFFKFQNTDAVSLIAK